MAITITTFPSAYMGAYNQVPYTISSNNTAEPNFNFIVDIKETTTAVLLARLKYPKQPGVATLTFDIGNVLANYVRFDFNNVTSVFAANTNSRLKYYVEFRELYDNPSGVPTLQSVSARHPTTPSTTSFNFATNSIFDFEQYSLGAMVGKSISNIGYLSTAPSTEKIETNQEKFLSWFDPSQLVKFIKYTGANGDVVTAVTLTPNEYLFSTRAGKYAQDTLIAGGISIIDTYKVELLGVTSNVLASRTFKLNTECSIYPTIRLHWMNKLGAFDSFNFNKNTINAMEIERKQFKAPLPIGYSKQDRLKTNYNTTINDRISINSDWITESESNLLEELATSPVIYLERTPTEFVAVNIVNTSYEIKTFLTDRKLFNVSFDIEYTYSRYRQSL
jgi:hypothetical protein